MADKNKQPSSSNHQQFSHVRAENPVMRKRMDKFVTEWEKLQRTPANTKEAEIKKKDITLNPQKKTKNDEK